MRFPGKVLSHLNGLPAICHVMARTIASKLVDKVYLATSNLDSNDVLESLARKNGWHLFRGSEPDVLSRFIEITKIEKPAVIVRVCADNFAIDPDVIDLGISELDSGGFDLCSAFIRRSYPFGVGAEISTAECLLKIFRETYNANDRYREHVFQWAIERPTSFRVNELVAPKPLHRPDISVSVDTMDDLQNVSRIYSSLRGKEGTFRTRELISIWDKLGLQSPG